MSARHMEPTERGRWHGMMADRMQMLGHRGAARFHERKQIQFERVIEHDVLSLPCIAGVVDAALTDLREVR